MEETMKKISTMMNISMGVTLSLILSTVNVLMSGHATLVSWLLSFIVSLVLSFIIGFTLPIKKISDSVITKTKTNGSKAEPFVSSAVSDLIYTPIITIIMVIVSINFALAGIDNQISALENESASYTQQLENETDPTIIGELNGKIAALDGQISGITLAKPSIGKTLPKSLFGNIVLGYAIIFFVQPKFLKITMKHYNVEI